MEPAESGLGVVELDEAIVAGSSERHGQVDQRQAGLDELDAGRYPLQTGGQLPPRLRQPRLGRSEPVKTRLDDVTHPRRQHTDCSNVRRDAEKRTTSLLRINLFACDVIRENLILLLKKEPLFFYE